MCRDIGARFKDTQVVQIDPQRFTSARLITQVQLRRVKPPSLNLIVAEREKCRLLARATLSLREAAVTFLSGVPHDVEVAITFCRDCY